MSGKNINFNEKKIEKSDFYKSKKLFNIDDFDVNKILVSKKEPYSKRKTLKYFIGYIDNDVIRPICLSLSKMTVYTRKFDKNVTVFLRVNDKQLLRNYNKIWEKVENVMKINFEIKPIYGDDGDKYTKTKIKLYADSIITNFHKKIPKQKAPCKCLSIIMLDCVIKVNKSCYPQTILEKCKYVQEKIKFEN